MRVVLTFAERMQIAEVFKTTINKENGSFLGKWDDSSIAKHLGGRISDHHVARLRREIYGPLYVKPTYPKHQETAVAPLGKWAQRVNDLELGLKQLQDRINYLERELGVAQ